MRHRLPRVAYAALLCAVAACGRGSTVDARHRAVEVGVDPLTLRWEGPTELAAQRATTIRCAMPGTCAVLFVAAEDSVVAAGETILELDARALADRRTSTAIELERARRDVAAAVAAIQVHTAELRASDVAAEGVLETARFDLDTNRGRRVTLEEATRIRHENEWARAVDDARLALENGRLVGAAKSARLESAHHAAKTILALREQELGDLDERLASAVVGAPHAGRVAHADPAGSAALRVGSLVRSGQSLLTVYDETALTARVRVPITLGTIETGTVVLVRPDASPGRTLRGSVTRSQEHSDPISVSRSSDFAQLEIAIDAVEGLPIRNGMSARIEFELGPFPGVVHVPLLAIQRHGEDLSVERLSSGTAVTTRVAIGRHDDSRAEILDGLAPGDRILIRAGVGARR